MSEKNTEEQAPESVAAQSLVPAKPAWFWIKDTKGFGSVSLTFATVAFWVTTVAYVASIFEAVGPIAFRAFDAGACAAFLIPVLSLYFGRKWTEQKKKDAE